jgi:hypothetical protein
MAVFERRYLKKEYHLPPQWLTLWGVSVSAHLIVNYSESEPGSRAWVSFFAVPLAQTWHALGTSERFESLHM